MATVVDITIKTPPSRLQILIWGSSLREPQHGPFWKFLMNTYENHAWNHGTYDIIWDIDIFLSQKETRADFCEACHLWLESLPYEIVALVSIWGHTVTFSEWSLYVGPSMNYSGWVNYNISLTWINGIWGLFSQHKPLFPVRSQWGRYNLPRLLSTLIAGWLSIVDITNDAYTILYVGMWTGRYLLWFEWCIWEEPSLFFDWECIKIDVRFFWFAK